MNNDNYRFVMIEIVILEDTKLLNLRMYAPPGGTHIIIFYTICKCTMIFSHQIFGFPA